MNASRLRGLLAAGLALLLAACSPAPAPLTHDAYVWQRCWQAPLATAMKESADLVGAWRILAGEVDARGRLRPVAVDAAAVAASGRPAIAVVRIAGPLALADPAAIAALARDWPAGIEIDHDSATAGLADYRRFLAALRGALPAGRRLSITLLPDWLDAPGELKPLLALADEAVLQLHSLVNPAGLLFDPASARRWTASLARLTDRPFRVALPTYGSRVVRDARRRITAVESETPVAGSEGGQEWFAPPRTVAAFLRDLEQRPPPHLAGVVWFRLPVAGDQRAWTAGTWRAVVRGTELQARLVAEAAATAEGSREVVLRNRGTIDAERPATLVVRPPCTAIAAAEPYLLEPGTPEGRFLRTHKGLLAAGSQLTVGTVHCPAGGWAVEIEP